MPCRVVVCHGTTALLVAWLSIAYAQDTGAINGQVFDPSRAAVPNATV